MNLKVLGSDSAKSARIFRSSSMLVFFQPVDELAVGKVQAFKSGVDFDDPETALVSFFPFSAGVGILTGVEEGLMGGSIKPAFGHPIALGLLEDFLVPFSSDDSGFNSSHIGDN